MELALSNGFCDLTNEDIIDITGGGAVLAAVSGVLTVIVTASFAYITPGGPVAKAKVAGKVLAEGIFLTATAYQL